MEYLLQQAFYFSKCLMSFFPMIPHGYQFYLDIKIWSTIQVIYIEYFPKFYNTRIYYIRKINNTFDQMDFIFIFHLVNMHLPIFKLKVIKRYVQRLNIHSQLFGINFSNHILAPPTQMFLAKPITCGGIEPQFFKENCPM